MNQIWLNAVRASARAALDPDAATLIAAMTTAPDAARQTLISDHIIALKAAGIWSQLDTYYMMAAHHEQASRLNWKSPGDFALEANGGITFTVDRGWQGDGSTGYLDTGWIPSSHGVNYQLNDASFGVYSRTDLDGQAVDMGVRRSDISAFSVFRLKLLNNQVSRINHGNTNFSTSVANSLGFGAIRRTTSSDVSNLRNGNVIGSGTVSSSAVPEFSFYIAALNFAGTVENFSARQYAAAFTAAAGNWHAALYDAMQNGYLAAVGAAV